MPAPDPNRLHDLKRRWARDPGSRLYLQLADEHRKHGQLEEAESVLVKGLEHRPSDLSGLVALGRCRLELGELDEAIASLETVIARDPGHMVANKLLVEAHLQQGDAEKAGERLTTYRLFNDRDPELEHLDYRLRQLRTTAAEEASTPEPVAEEPAAEAVVAEESEPAAVEAEAAEPQAAEPQAAEPQATEPEAVEPEAAEPEPPAPRPEPVAAVGIPLAAPSNGDEVFHLGAVPAAPKLEVLWREPLPVRRLADPFSGLIAPPSADALPRGDIFRFEPPPVSEEPPPVSEEPPAEEPVSEEPPAEEPPPAFQALFTEPPPVDEEAPTERLAIAEMPDTGPPAVDEEAPTEQLEVTDLPLVEPAVEEPVVEEPVVEEPVVEEPVVEEPVVEEPVVEPPVEKIEVQPPAAEEPPAQVVAEAAEEPPEAAEEPPEAEPEATVTLGGLYLQQGHHEEAARIFEQVLERDPASSAARAGLDLAQRPQAAPLTAIDLLADRSLSGTIPMGMTARKLQVLTNYLKHIRRARETDHVH